MIGPCMCGDPYCPSCGDPGLAKFEAFIEELSEEMSKLTEDECHVFVAAGRAAVAAVAERFVPRELYGELQYDLEQLRDGIRLRRND